MAKELLEVLELGSQPWQTEKMAKALGRRFDEMGRKVKEAHMIKSRERNGKGRNNPKGPADPYHLTWERINGNPRVVVLTRCGQKVSVPLLSSLEHDLWVIKRGTNCCVYSPAGELKVIIRKMDGTWEEDEAAQIISLPDKPDWQWLIREEGTEARLCLMVPEGGQSNTDFSDWLFRHLKIGDHFAIPAGSAFLVRRRTGADRWSVDYSYRFPAAKGATNHDRDMQLIENAKNNNNKKKGELIFLNARGRKKATRW